MHATWLLDSGMHGCGRARAGQCSAATASGNLGLSANDCEFSPFEFRNTSVVIRSVAGSLTDLAQVTSLVSTSIRATETGDTNRPRIISGSIDFNNGNLVVIADEVLDLFDPSLSILPAKIALRGASEAAVGTISIDGVDWVSGVSPVADR